MPRRSLPPAASRATSAVLASTLVFFCAASAPAQIPDRFTNLQVIDAAVGMAELVGTMRGITTALGVRCTYCHVGPDDLVGMDFATDEKPEKRAARQMLVLVREINGPLLAGLPSLESGVPAQRVSCYTCHRGAAKPPPAARDLLLEIAERDGVEAALAEYRRLRAEHWGTGRYDLSPRTLVALGQRLAEQGRTDDALAAYRGGLDELPDSADLYAAMGNLHAQAGHIDDARSALARALELDPQHAIARWGLSRLEAAAASRPPR